MDFYVKNNVVSSFFLLSAICNGFTAIELDLALNGCKFVFYMTSFLVKTAIWLDLHLFYSKIISKIPCLPFLVRAGQGVAAVVGAHVERGVHGVGEVGGLVGVQGKVSIQQLPHVVVGLPLVHFVRGVPDLHVHGAVGHPLVLEALGTFNSPFVPHKSHHGEEDEEQQDGDDDGGGSAALLLAQRHLLAARARPARRALAFGQLGLVADGAGAAVQAEIVTGQAARGDLPIGADAGDLSTLLVDAALALLAAGALVLLALGTLKLRGAAALLGTAGCHLAHAVVLAVIEALPVLAAVPDEGGQAAAAGLVALVDAAAAVVLAVARAHLLVTPGPRETRGAAARRHS